MTHVLAEVEKSTKSVAGSKTEHQYVRTGVRPYVKNFMENKLKLGVYEHPKGTAFCNQSLRSRTKWEHYKSKRYEVISMVKHSETLEELVIYKALYGSGDVWARPLKMFLEEVEVNGEKIPRFKYIG